MIAMHNVEGIKSFEDSYCRDVFDERVRHCSARIITDEGNVKWVTRSLRIRYTIRVDDKLICQAPQM